jgi:hypothetical protein
MSHKSWVGAPMELSRVTGVRSQRLDEVVKKVG